MDARQQIEAQTQAIILLAQQQGWTQREIDAVLREARAPLDGLRHSLLSAMILLEMARCDERLWRATLFKLDAAGAPMLELNETILDFTSKEGKERRSFAQSTAQSMRAGLGEARRHYAQASFFQSLLGKTIPVADAEVRDADDDGERSAEDRAKEELERRMAKALEIARENMNGPGPAKGRRTRIKKEGKRGVEKVDEVMEAQAEMFAEAERLMGGG